MCFFFCYEANSTTQVLDHTSTFQHNQAKEAQVLHLPPIQRGGQKIAAMREVEEEEEDEGEYEDEGDECDEGEEVDEE